MAGVAFFWAPMRHATAIEPVVLLLILGVSYFTRPANRGLMREGRAPMKELRKSVALPSLR